MAKELLPFVYNPEEILKKPSISDFISDPIIFEISGIIHQSWQKVVEGILEVSIILCYAKEKLNDSQYSRLLEKLPFGKRTAERLVAIGNDSRIATHASLVPASWTTLYELSRLDNAQFQKGLDNGIICKDMIRSDVKKITQPKASAIVSNPSDGMVKAFIVYCEEDQLDQIEDKIKLIQTETNDSDNLTWYCNDEPGQDFIKKAEEKQQKEILKAARTFRIEQIKTIRHFYNDKIREFGKARVERMFPELKDFVSGGTQEYINNPICVATGENIIDSMFSIMGLNIDEYMKTEGLLKHM